jgi:hypothetical protein
MIEIIFHFYGIGGGLAFVVKEGENTFYLSPGDINPSVLLAYCEAMIDFHRNFNTYLINNNFDHINSIRFILVYVTS